MSLGIKATGADKIQRNLERIVAAQTEIARRTVNAGCAVLVRACRDASPGTVKREVGRYVKAEGAVARGRAGLIRLPKRGQVGKGPHGIYLDQGTKFIAAQHFIGNALATAKASATAAMAKSLERSIDSVTSEGN